MPDDLRALLATGRPVLLDGAMGTMLQQAGLEAGACGEAWNLARPDVIRGIHAAYRKAGSEILSTNTFGANAVGLGRHGEAENLAAINHRAVTLARDAAGPRGLILGDVGPTGAILAPVGDADPGAVYAAFRDQAAQLVGSGVDGLLLETFTALDEMQLALRAAREARAPVIFASLAFDRLRSGDYRTMMGVSPEAAAEALAAGGADVLGCNCGTNLRVADYAAIARRMRSAAAKPVLVQPNAGQPELSPEGVAYRETPASLAASLHLLLDAGVTVVGGCCGTTPHHIALFRKMLDAQRPAK